MIKIFQKLTSVKINSILSLIVVNILAIALLQAQAPAKKPNIIFVLADDVGMECFGSYGSEYYKTPHLDKLAAGGAKFAEAYSQPLCTPSRVQLLTGRHNFRNYTAFGLLDLTQPTLAQALKQAGYATYTSGKWQLSKDLKAPFTAGFDDYCLWNFTGEEDSEGKKDKKGGRYKSPALYVNGKPLADTKDKYGPDITLDHAIDFIKKHKDQPFLVYHTTMLVHKPFDPTPASPDWEKTDKNRSDLEHFKDMVEYLDGQMGKLVKVLEDLGIRDNTLIVFTGDNGTHKSIISPFPQRKEKEIVGGKGTMTDAGNHVAFIANWPNQIKPGTVVKTQIDFTDIFPTFCNVAGADKPANLDGQDLMPFMLGDESKARGWVFQSYSPSGDNYRFFVRQGPYKLYSTGEFYNVPQDWLEKTPITSPEFKEVRARLQSILDAELKDYKGEEYSKKAKRK
jgi:arylsulfatase A